MSIALSKKLRQSTPDLLMHWCPACRARHGININTPNMQGAVWQWDGNKESPTFGPSINIAGRCHYFIRGGQIEFCADSAHDLAGQTVPLPDWPEWFS